MGTSVTTDYVQVKVTFANSYTATSNTISVSNEVTNLHISVTKNPIDIGETTTWNTTVDFTSGSEGVSVNGSETFSGYDTSIIQIDNT